MNNRTRIRKADAATTEVNRLHDMLVEEVSLVDRAANKRTFLIVKRDGGVASEVVPNGQGGYTVRKDLVTGDGAVNDTQGGSSAATGPATPTGAPPKKKPKLDKATLTLQPDAQKAISAGLADAVDQLTAFQKEIDGAATDETAPPNPEVGQALKSVCDELAQLAGAQQPAEAAAASNMPATEQGAAAAAADAGRESAKRLSDVVKGIRADVEKAGAKMAKERFARFKVAFDALESIMKELMGAGADEEEAAAGAPPPKKPGQPAAPAAKTGEAPPPPAPAAAVVATSAPATAPQLDPQTQAAINALQDQINQLGKRNENMSTLVKRQAAQLTGLAVPATSNASVVENAVPRARTGSGDPVWPRDMNDRSHKDAATTF